MNGVTLNDLFLAAVRGQTRNHERLGREAKCYARKISMRFAGGLPEDLHEEIFDEAFAQMWTMLDQISDEQPPLKLYRRAVLLAIRAVRVSYTPPGQRTRATKEAVPPRVAAEDVGTLPSVAAVQAATVGQGDHRVIDLDRLPSPDQPLEVALENRSEVVAILHRSPPSVSTALERIYLRDMAVGAVARDLGLSRFVMRHRIETFVKAWRAAA